MIPYGRQSIDESDIQAVVRVLRGDFLTTGPAVEAFETALCEKTGAKYAVAVSSGTAALHLAALGLLRPGWQVLTPANSFVATANSILYAGATPIFADIDECGNIDLDTCEKICEQNANIKAIFAVHFGGRPLDFEKLLRLKNRFGLVVLEDACHALGAVGVGRCASSEAAVFSFHPVKHITTGEGGAIVTNDESLAKKMRILRSHGITRDSALWVDKNAAFDEDGSPNPWYYEQQSLGYNYRITDFQCALGLSQLQRLDSFVDARRQIAKRYCEAFAGLSYIQPLHDYDENAAYHLFVVTVDFEALDVTRAAFMRRLMQKGVSTQVHYIPVNTQPYYRSLGYGHEDLPLENSYYERCLSLPMYADLSLEEQQQVIDGICSWACK